MNPTLSDKASGSTYPSDNKLIAAIFAADHVSFYAELEKTKDVNIQGGVFLRCAAEVGNSLFMRELVMAGADINYAYETAHREMIPIKFEWQKPHGFDNKIFNSPEDKTKYERLSKVTERLHYFKETFVKMIVPIEIARHQKVLMQEMQEMRRELTEMREAKPIEKRNLRPAIPSNNG